MSNYDHVNNLILEKNFFTSTTSNEMINPVFMNKYINFTDSDQGVKPSILYSTIVYSITIPLFLITTAGSHKLL